MPVDASSGGVSGNGGAPCLAAPTIPDVSLPFPFSLPTLGIATPKLSFTLCCTVTLPSLSATLPLPPIPIGILGPGATALITDIVLGVGIVNKFLRSLVLKCPIQ